ANHAAAAGTDETRPPPASENDAAVDIEISPVGSGLDLEDRALGSCVDSCLERRKLGGRGAALPGRGRAGPHRGPREWPKDPRHAADHPADLASAASSARPCRQAR